MGEIIVLDQESKKRLLEGIALLARCLRGQVGANKPYVVLRRLDGDLSVSNEEDVIAEMVHVENPIEELGIEVLRECGRQTLRKTGGGLTLTILLAEAVIRGGMRHVFSGMDPLELKRALDAALIALLVLIDQMPVHLKSTSSQITVEDGYVSPYFVTNPEVMQVELDNPYVFITDKRLKRIYDIIPILENRNNLLIISEDVDDEALATLVVNCVKGGMQLCAIKTSEVKKIVKTLGADLYSFIKVEKVIASKESTTITLAQESCVQGFPSLDLISLADEIKDVLRVAFSEISSFFPQPAVVIKEALANALLTATALLTVEAMVATNKKA